MENKFKAGDRVRVTNYGGKTEGINYSNIQAMIGKVYTIDSVGNVYYYINSEPFKEDEIELANEETRDKPRVAPSKVLIVDKVRPQYSTYVESSKEAIEKFFFGTRIFDFYIIKDGKLIELASQSDIEKLYLDTPIVLSMKKAGDSFELDGVTLTMGIDLNRQNETWFYVKGTAINEGGKQAIYLKKIGDSTAFYTLQEFADMIKNKTYRIGV